ncbi:MAG: ZIP family metal transporter [Pirellulales bacterium]
MTSSLLLVVYCVLIFIASLLGGMIPLVVRLTHKRMELAVSFVAGLMLGVGALHLLPHAIVELGPDAKLDWVMWSLMGGFLAMFFVERFFCFHHHDAPDETPEEAAEAIGCEHHRGEGHPHIHPHGEQPHGEECADGHASDAAGVPMQGEHSMTWTGAAIGMTLHSVLDGVALAASVAADSDGHRHFALAGFGTFLVVFCHKPFDSLTLGTLLARGTRPSPLRHVVNSLFSLAVVGGVLLFQAGLAGTPGKHDAFLACSLAFAAGTFLCIAMSDLLPELQFHHHDRAKLSLALLAGLALAWSVGYFETTGHQIQRPDGASQRASPT